MPATLGNTKGALSEITGSTEAPSARKRVETFDVRYENTRKGCDLGDNDSLSSGGIDGYKKAFYRK